jgi:uncharacterized phage protein (TIGR01671 family)
MRREIKFRGLSIAKNEWVCGCYVKFDGYPDSIVTLKSEVEGVWQFDYTAVFPESVGQFTDHLDNKGSEIYEGDIVHVVYKDSDFMGEDADYKSDVYWDSQTAAFMIRRPVGADTLEDVGANTIEIIGSIHTTPELVKQNI